MDVAMQYDDFEEDLLPTRSFARERALALTLAVVVLVGAGFLAAQLAFTGSSTGSPVPVVRASADGVAIIVPGKSTQRVAAAQPIAGTTPRQSGVAAEYRFPNDGSLVTVGRITTRASTGAATASARAEIGTVRMLDGRIAITGVVQLAHATITGGRRATGSVALQPGASLRVDGRPVRIAPNHQVVVRGVGSLSINEQAVVASAPTGDRQTGPRHRVVGTALHLRLSHAYKGLPAGSEVLIGRVDAGVRQGKVTAVAHARAGRSQPPPTPSALPAPSSSSGLRLQPGLPAPGTSSLPRRGVSVRANAAGGPKASLQGYVFPVLGAAGYSNDWGAARASTGIPHQGNDIFAAEGTPIVAVADGVLDRVGWNSIGGYRFWLFDQYGNGFYHAHLSAYSPLAVDGAAVRAGDVIGFVGHTGDAQGTPDHVHFEVHPGNGAATNPFPFLNAWKHGVAAAISALQVAGVDAGKAPLALLEMTDISANSGLGASILDRVPDTSERPIAQETAPVPTDDSLQGAIDGPGISQR